MSRYTDLLDELKSCVDDWDGDFKIDVKQEEFWKGAEYFSVIISHNMLGQDYYFRCRVDDDGKCEMAMGEDYWRQIAMGNLFALMWFETSQPKPVVGK